MKTVIFIFIISLTFLSCRQNHCENRFEFEITKELLYAASEKGYRYCEWISESLNGNKKAVASISLCNFENGLTYEHGAILIEIVAYSGENQYIQIIQEFPIHIKDKIFYYILAGSEFTHNPDIRGKEFSEFFPTLYTYLKNDL